MRGQNQVTGAFAVQESDDYRDWSFRQSVLYYGT